MADHDHAYKLLFTQREMVAHLLKHLAPREKWVREADLSTLQQLGGRHISDDWRERENDAVWRVRRKDGLHLYLLIEFQSTPDPYMAARVLAYRALLYQELIRREMLEPSGRLPRVVAIVLYNGEQPWKAASQIAQMIDKTTRGLENHDLQLSFTVVDIGRLRPEEIADPDNLAAALFRLENSRSLEEVERELEGLFKRLSGPRQSHLLQAFLSWLRRVLMPLKFPGEELPALGYEEGKSMLAERAKRWAREMEEERAREREEEFNKGRAAGRLEGQAANLTRLLKFKFGSLPANCAAAIESADSSMLLEWTRMVLIAKRLEEIFE